MNPRLGLALLMISVLPPASGFAGDDAPSAKDALPSAKDALPSPKSGKDILPIPAPPQGR